LPSINSENKKRIIRGLKGYPEDLVEMKKMSGIYWISTTWWKNVQAVWEEETSKNGNV